MSTNRLAQLRATVVAAIGIVAVALWLAVAPRVVVADYDGGWPSAAALVACVPVSVLLCARLPGAAVTRVIAVFTLGTAVTLLDEAIGLWPYVSGHAAVPAHVEGPLGSLTVALWVTTLPMLPVLLVVFPDGVPVSRWWRAVLVTQLAAVVAGVPVLVDQGDGQMSLLSSVTGTVAGVVILASGMLRAVALTWQWRRAQGQRRAQLTPFVATAGALAAFYALTGTYLALTGRDELGSPVVSAVLFALVLAALPCALGVSVLRHHLFGIEVMVNRVAVATLLSLLLFGVYAAVATLVASATGGGGPQWRPLLAASVTVAALGPLYRVARSIIDRAMFGDRDRPDRVLGSLSASLGDAVDPFQLPQIIVRTIAETLRLPYVALHRATALASAAGSAPVLVSSPLAVIGQEPNPQRIDHFDISFGGDRLAQLSVGARTGQSALTIADRRLLSDLARQAGPALYASSLVEELAQSRERLRRGWIEERAVMSRALHDSVSPTLAGIALAAAAAQLRAPGDPGISALLDRIEHEAGAGSTILKALLAGLRPPGLDDVGLVPALEHRAAELEAVAGLRFEIDALDGLPALDSHVEEAAYLVTVEAMANAARHAGASRCHVEITAAAGDLLVAITDDGGGPGGAHRDGNGLRSARERAQACGGTLVLGARERGGTRVLLTLPAWTQS